MKSRLTRLCSAAALIVLAPGLLDAQQVMHTAEEIFISGHFFSASSDDLAIIDRASGEVRSLNNAAASVQDGPVRLSGVGDVSEATSGTLGLGGSIDVLMLVSATSQSLARISPADPAGAISIYESPKPAPVGIVALNFPTSLLTRESSGDLWVSSHDIAQSSLAATGVTTSSLSIEASSNRPIRLREGRRARFGTLSPFYAAFIAEAGAGSIMQFFSGLELPGNASITLEAQLTGLPADASFVWGSLDASARSTFAFFVPGSPVMHWIRTASGSSAAVTNTFTASAGIEGLIPVNQGAAHGVWAILDGGTQMQLLQFDGSRFSVSQTLVAPPGQRWTGGAAADGGSNLLMLQGSASGGGSTSWNRFDVQGNGTYTSESQGPLPTLVSPSPAHVFAFSGEPFVDTGAALTDSRRVADWTLGTSALPGSLVMSGQKESFGGESAGLGARSSFNAGTAAAGSTWMLANQYAADTSVFALLPGRLSPQEPTVDIVPAANHEELPPGAQTPPAVRSFAFESTGFAWYRTSASSAFVLFNPNAADPEFSIATVPESVTIEYYAKSGPVRSRLQRATYSFGAVDPITPPSSIDADGNGLADEWENWYGLSDPNGDPDNDGINNITEQNIGSDPLGHCGEDALPLEFSLQRSGQGAGATVQVTLTRELQPGEILQLSTNLETWSDLSLDAGELEYSLPLAGAPRRFFRLQRP